MTETTAFDRDDPPVLGAIPFVGLTRDQVLAALARLGQRVAVEPGVVVATAVDAFAEFMRVAVGRSDVAPGRRDRRSRRSSTHRTTRRRRSSRPTRWRRRPPNGARTPRR
jgi:hypothetical protein